VILNDLLCQMNRMTVVPTYKFFELDAVAVFRDLTEAILFHARNLNEFRVTRNIVFGLTRSGILCSPAPASRRYQHVACRSSTLTYASNRGQPMCAERDKLVGEQRIRYPGTNKVIKGPQMRLR